MRTAAVAAVLFLLLSGCAQGPGPAGTGGTGGTDPLASPDCRSPPARERVSQTSQPGGRDWSLETLWVNVTSAGPFAIEVPVPESPAGTGREDWLGNAEFPAGWTWEPGTTQRAPLLRLTGTGPGSLRACAIQVAAEGGGCCAEAYLDATWGGGTAERPDAVGVAVLAGRVDVGIAYRARSDWCGAWADYAGAGLPPGWHEMPGAAQAVCA